MLSHEGLKFDLGYVRKDVTRQALKDRDARRELSRKVQFKLLGMGYRNSLGIPMSLDSRFIVASPDGNLSYSTDLSPREVSMNYFDNIALRKVDPHNFLKGTY